MVAAKCTLVRTMITVITTDIGAAAFGFTMTDMVAAVAIARVMHAPIAGAGAVPVSVAASGTTAAKKSTVSQTRHLLGSFGQDIRVVRKVDW